MPAWAGKIFKHWLAVARPLGLVGGLKPFPASTLPIIEKIKNNNTVISDCIENADLLNYNKTSYALPFNFKCSNFREFT